MSTFTYKIYSNGYDIYSNGELMLTQRDPYIPNKNISYEENAKLQIEELTREPEPEPPTIEEQIADLKDTVSTNQGGVDELGSVISDLASALDDLASTVSAMTEEKQA